jgi:type I restriction enzyme, S subunit
MTRLLTTATSTTSQHSAVPEGWSIEQIRGFATIGTGARDTQDRSASGKYPFFVRSQKVERIDSWSFDGEAVLTAGDGVGTGKVFHYINGRFDYHQRVYRISYFRSDVSGKYFFYQFSQNFLARIESLTAKSSVDSVRMETIAGMDIALPGRAEQDRIVEAIDDADELVCSLERLIAKTQAIKHGMMQQLLTGKTRLAGFTAPWQTALLGDHFEITSSRRVFQKDWRSSGVPFYRARELAILGDRGRVDNELFIDRKMFNEYRRLYGAPNLGDFLVTGVGTLGKTYVVRPGDEFYFKDGNILWFKSSQTVDSNFLRLLYSTPLIERQISDGSSGTTVGTYTITNAKKTRIPLPTISEQKAIAAVLADVEGEIDALRHRLTKARALKQGMMQELLTGRTHLPVKESAA